LTGSAWRTPLGGDIDLVMRRYLASERIAHPDRPFTSEGYRSVLRAPVEGEPTPSRHRRFLRRMALLAVEVGKEAARRAGVQPGDRLGLFVATGSLRANWEQLMPALAGQRLDGSASWENGFSRLHPFWMLQYLSNNAQALLAADIGASGEGMTFGGASAGAQAIAAANRALHAGAIDQAIVLAYDSLLDPETLVELGERGAVTEATRAAELVAPYADGAAGFVPAEAAAAVVLERPEQAGDRAIAWVEAGTGADGGADQPGGRAIAEVLSRLTPAADVVDGAARALPDLDGVERRAIASVLGEDVLLGASSAAMGEIGVAKPLTQVILLTECLRRNAFAAIAGLHRAAPGPLKPLTQPVSPGARSAIGLTTGAPGLIGAVRVQLP
jgi:3-oxoacyl-(acyl-carrier-protein) synthase